MNKPMANRGFCSIFKGGVFWWLNGCHQFLYVFSLMLCVVVFLPCDGTDRIDAIQNTLLYNGCEKFRDFDGSAETEATLTGHFELEELCFQSHSLCFPSTLIGLGMNLDGLHSDKKNLDANNVGSCKRSPLPNPMPLAFFPEFSTSPYVDINPPLLDWGTNSLFTPSLAHLTVANARNGSIMHVFEPFSSDGQFYAYGFEKLSLAPGEAGSIAFVFLPRRLGLSSAHVVLQTSFGGFVIHAQGSAIQSPYGFHPSRGFELLFDGKLIWNLSLCNTLDEVLYVEEISARISVYSGNTIRMGQFNCRVLQSQNSLGHFGSFCKIGETDFPLMEIRPHEHWEVSPLNTEIIMEMNLYPPFKGNISGDICVNLWNYTRDKFKTIMVPLEAEVDGKTTYNSLTGSISVFFDSLAPWDVTDLVCTLSLRNRASYLLSVVSIAGNLKVFEIKYMEGLLLYPDTITQVALTSYTHPDVSEHIPPKIPWMSQNCKLSLLTNDSISPQIDITCEDLVQNCCRNGFRSGFTEPESSFVGLTYQELKLSNTRTGSLECIVEESVPQELKLQELLEADRLLLGNWRSQGTMSSLSVLKDREPLFPVIQIGVQFSKWITVHNPSQKPVVMQFVLNSGAIIDHCKSPDDSFVKSDDGFSMPETAATQVFGHPFESAQIGPVFFRPSKRCTWRSSVLIRNNLSGVELLQLQAFGGSRSLRLLERSKTVKKIEFKLDLPTNSSIHLETSRRSCSGQLYKELYATNAGELPLEVIKLEVSGIDCGSDGFVIHSCKGFFLEPGESIKFLISYKPDFSGELVQRGLKLTMDTGFLVIPMEARLLVLLKDLCKESLVWTVIWKLLALFFIAVSVVCVLLFVLTHPIASGSKDYSVKSENAIAISTSEKLSCVHRSTRNGRPSKKHEKREENFVIDRHPCCEHSVDGNTQRAKEKKDADHQKKSTFPSPPPTKLPFETLDCFETSESPQCVNLTVKVVKEKGRRRKKKAGGGLASKFEVSSSQSGNSTPSSPMSPNVFTPNSSFSSFSTVSKGQNHEKKLDFGFSMEAKVLEPLRNAKRPVLSSSASFPCSGYHAPSVVTSHFLASSSPIAPYARAPGSKLGREKGMKTEEVSFSKEYTYDIWGNHFCGHLMGKVNELSSKMCDASEGNSQSFFTRDPQSLMMRSSAQSKCSGIIVLGSGILGSTDLYCYIGIN